MTRKEAVKRAIKTTGQLGLEYSKRVVLTVCITGVGLIAVALIKPNFLKYVSEK